MKNKYLYILSALFLGACAAPTSSLDLSSNKIDKTGYLFYQNSDINPVSYTHLRAHET